MSAQSERLTLERVEELERDGWGPVTFEECSHTLRASTGGPPNTMRISLGLASNFADVFAFLTLAKRFVDVPSDELPAAPGVAATDRPPRRQAVNV